MAGGLRVIDKVLGAGKVATPGKQLWFQVAVDSQRTAGRTAAVAVLLLQQQLSTTVYNVSAQVKIFYEGSFPDGKVFDKNYNRKSPLTFRVGLGDVIKGMDRGMKLAHKLALKLAFYSVHDMRITQQRRSIGAYHSCRRILHVIVPFSCKHATFIMQCSVEICDTRVAPRTVSYQLFNSSGCMEGMRVGGQRELIIPSGLGYGKQGAGPIGPNQDLVFHVELLDVSGR
eukprot:17530-Heterococcus_DN1.PRE.1